MGKSFVSVRLTLLFSLSVTASYSLTPSSFTPKQSSSPYPKATPSDLLSLLGPKSRSSSIDPLLAKQLTSCFKFLVPFKPNTNKPIPDNFPGRKFLRLKHKAQREEDQNGLVWCPPQPVLELARLAVDSGGDPATIHRALDPTMITVPDVEGCEEDRCQLTRTPYGRNFMGEELNSYIAFLFEIIRARGPTVGLNVSLSRYDLFHGHLFLALDTGRLGILFHAKEFPAYDKEVFPYNMGYCQTGSNVTYDDSMNLRNILWLAPLPSNSAKCWEAPGVLVVLDARPDGIIYRDIIPEYVNFARTIYEDDLGEVAVDVNYLAVGNPESKFKLFIC